MRHLQRNHETIKEVQNIVNLPKNSKERRYAMALLRNETRFNMFLKGSVHPNRQRSKTSIQLDQDVKYFPCVYCKGLYLKDYLRRHVKTCIIHKTRYNDTEEGIKNNYLSRSHTLIACAGDPTNVISQLNVKEQVFLISLKYVLLF